LCHFKFLTMINTIAGTGSVGARAGAASRYGSGSDQKMRLLAAPAPQHWFQQTAPLTLCLAVGLLDHKLHIVEAVGVLVGPFFTFVFGYSKMSSTS
jgi:hypothetical protein